MVHIYNKEKSYKIALEIYFLQRKLLYGGNIRIIHIAESFPQVWKKPRGQCSNQTVCMIYLIFTAKSKGHGQNSPYSGSRIPFSKCSELYSFLKVSHFDMSELTFRKAFFLL